VAEARTQARRKQSAPLGVRGHRDEFLDATATMDSASGAGSHGEPASHTASERGAGRLGFTGTTRTTAATPSGLVQVAIEGTNDTVPLLPTTWRTDADETPEPH
jgi:hypothetical protein